MPPKKAIAAPPPAVVPKKHFFTPRSQVTAEVVSEPVVKAAEELRPPRYTPRPRYLIDPDTELAYAEIINGVAVCLETGQDMFEVRSAEREEEDAPIVRRYDFKPPASRHPLDIVSQDLIDEGVLTEGHFRAGEAGLSRAQYVAWLEKHQ
jgi:hypothetical protein